MFPSLRTALALLVGSLIGPAIAAPAPIVERDSLSVLSSSQVDSYTSYTLFASASYCGPILTQNWLCGPACAKLSGFKPVASGGDGAVVQYWFVGYYPPMSSVVVVYQGTDPLKILPILTDLNFFLTQPDASLFPGLPSSAQVHNGFLSAYKLSQSDVFAAVKQASATYGTKKVTLIGHSMGSAMSVLAAASMKLRLDSSYTFKVVGFGQPRVGNPAWASWVDSSISDLTRINNKHDPIPILPDISMGFSGTHGEIHIRDDNSWASCPGDDNTATGCTVHDVGNLLISNIVDHLGPYNGILMGLCGLS